MAGEWLKFEANTPEKPEVFAITVALGWDDPDLTVGKLLKVWRWFDQQSIEGNAPNVTLALLDRISGVTGFAKCMCDVGWLNKTDTGLSLPNFDRHNGKTAKDRALTAKRVAKHKSNGASVSIPLPAALPREEKRREEVNNPPIPPEGEKPDRKRSAIALKTFLDECKIKSEMPIPDDAAAIVYANSVGIPPDFLWLQWREFLDRYKLPDAKRYKNWRIVFLKSVRGNWFKLWYVKDGQYLLSTVGKQAQKLHGEKGV